MRTELPRPRVKDREHLSYDDFSSESTIQKVNFRPLADEQDNDFPFEICSAPLTQRVVEFVIALGALILCLPVMAIVGLIIRLNSPGPALFFQKRLAAGAREYRFVKFRTLYADAKERFPHLYAYDYNSEELQDLCFKVVKDPRVTPAGEWLRMSTLDELPNLWCVLTGEMALVGPRPEIPEMLPYYEGEMMKKFQVRPGITGLAQVSGRGRLGFYESVDLDVEYVENRSLWLDVKILCKTIQGVILRDGAF